MFRASQGVGKRETDQSQSTIPTNTEPVHLSLTFFDLYWSHRQHMNAALAPTPALSRGADTTLTDQLSARFSERIRQRLLAPGTRLPSVRECARRHGVSAYTVAILTQHGVGPHSSGIWAADPPWLFAF